MCVSRESSVGHAVVCVCFGLLPAGRNTHMAAHELSRVQRREEDVEGVRALMQQVGAGPGRRVTQGREEGHEPSVHQLSR